MQATTVFGRIYTSEAVKGSYCPISSVVLFFLDTRRYGNHGYYKVFLKWYLYEKLLSTYFSRVE